MQATQERIMLNHFGAATEMLQKSSSECTLALKYGVLEDNLENIAVACVETMVLRGLERLKVEDFSKPSPSWAMLTEFLTHAVEASRNPEFLAHGLKKDLVFVRTVLQAKTSDVMELKSVLEQLEEVASQPDDASPLVFFLVSHDVGKMLNTHASDILAASHGKLAIEQKSSLVHLLMSQITSDLNSPSSFPNAQKNIKRCIAEIGYLKKDAKKDASSTKLAQGLECRFHAMLLDAVTARSQALLANADKSIKNWLELGTEALTLCINGVKDLDALGYEASDCLQDLPKEVHLQIQQEEQTYRDMHNFAAHLAAKLRPTATAEAILSGIDKVIDNTHAFAAMPAALLDSIASLLSNMSKPARLFLASLGFMHSQFVVPFQNYIIQRERECMQTFSEQCVSAPSGARGGNLSTLKTCLKLMPEDALPAFNAVIGIMMESEQLTAVHRATARFTIARRWLGRRCVRSCRKSRVKFYFRQSQCLPQFKPKFWSFVVSQPG